MEIPFALLCGYASTGRDGRLHIVDGDMDVFQAHTPGKLAQPIYLALKLLFTREECGRQWIVRIEFGPEGGPPLIAEDTSVRPKPPPPERDWQKIVAAVAFRDVQLPRAGVYLARVIAEGAVLRTVRLFIEEPPQRG